MSELYDRTSASLYAVATRILADPADVEAAVAAVYVQVWREAGAYDSTLGSVKSWLLVLCRDCALAVLRSDATMGKAAAASCQDLLCATDGGSDLHAGLATLSPLQRELLGLALFRGMDHAAISSHAGLPLVTVESEMARAAASLRDSMDGASDSRGEAEPPSLESIVITPQLQSRPSRPSDYEAEARAMEALTQELARPCGRILGKLVEAAMELCHAHSAGISIMESSGEGVVFRWHAIVGEFAAHQGGSLPRNESPCGIVVDRNAAQLIAHPERYFANLRGVSPRVVEVLLVPFHMLGQPVGTVWVLSHREDTHFCAEDCRTVTALARFAAAAYLLRSSQEAALEARDELVQANERLHHANDLLNGISAVT